MVDKHYAVTTIDILRHGECEGGRIFRGSTDVSLNELGWQQMGAAVDFLQSRGEEWDSIVSSPLQRCLSFARARASTLNKKVQVVEDFRETHFGRWEGSLIDDVWVTDRIAVDAWMLDPANNHPPGGEASDDFYRRVERQLQQLVEECSGQHLLLIVHGGVIRMLLAHCLSMPLSSTHKLEVPYACLSRMRFSHDLSSGLILPQLIFHNVHYPSLSTGKDA